MRRPMSGMPGLAKIDQPQQPPANVREMEEEKQRKKEWQGEEKLSGAAS